MDITLFLNKKFILVALLFVMNTCKSDLILLASPDARNGFYRDKIDDILGFHINYAKQIIHSGDDVLILTSKEFYQSYITALSSDKVIIAPMLDIWMCDFTFTNPEKPIMFRYTAEGQGGGKQNQIQADHVQSVFYEFATNKGLEFIRTNILNDAGNFVYDYKGSVVISTKFLRDNNLSENQARKKLKSLIPIKHIAFIEAEDEGILEHADGIVSFIDENTIVINSYPEYPEYSKKLKKKLTEGLPNVRIYEIITPYSEEKLSSKKFGSACGIYTNMLVTRSKIYFPIFGIPEDEIALEQIKNITSKKVIPVLSSQICDMGGAVRCMSLLVDGENKRQLLKAPL